MVCNIHSVMFVYFDQNFFFVTSAGASLRDEFLFNAARTNVPFSLLPERETGFSTAIY